MLGARMTPEPQASPHADWAPVERPGCVNVEARVLLIRDGLLLAMLRFAPRATIDEHAADHEIDVVCVEGEGFISVEDRINSFVAGQWMTWPASHVHRLWTGDHGMITMVLERLP
jgi:quercetin dioxygenase-like cupin family protein